MDSNDFIILVVGKADDSNLFKREITYDNNEILTTKKTVFDDYSTLNLLSQIKSKMNCEDDDKLLDTIIKVESVSDCYDYSYLEDFKDETFGIDIKKEPSNDNGNSVKYKKTTVFELKKDNPNMAKNQKLLIRTLVNMMTKERPPLPPENIYTVLKKGLRCIYCKTITPRHNAATRHYQEYHGPRYLSCYGCGADFRSTTNLYKHERNCSSRDAVVVLKARAIFLGRKGRGRPFIKNTPFLKKINMGDKSADLNLKSKEYIVHKNDKLGLTYLCSECPAKFKTKYGLIAHKRMHQGFRPFQCESCPASYTAKSALNRHMLAHIGPQFTCDYCGRSVMTKAALRHHIDTHFKIKNFHCSECNKKYSQKNALVLHINKVHKKLPPSFVCQMCTKGYYRVYLLKEHMMKEHGMVLLTKTMILRSLAKAPKENLEIFSTDT